MSSLTQNSVLGIDVSKDSLDFFDGYESVQIKNAIQEIEEYLSRFNAGSFLAVEPTSRYHQQLVDIAIRRGIIVYLVDPYRVSRYRDAIGYRVKTDYQDAKLLYRYLKAEKSNLKPFRPAPEPVTVLLQLLHARGKLAKEKSSIRQSLSSVKSLTKASQQIIDSIDEAMEEIDNQLKESIKQAGYDEDYQRCMEVPGIGPVVSTGVVAMFHRGEFKNADAFIAFLGLDVRVRESGKYKGQRKLTKKGDPELRRLLFNGARAGSRTKYWNDYYNSLRERGLKTTQATIAVARKITKVAFALLRDQKEFIAQRG